jgi:hypothetical protein
MPIVGLMASCRADFAKGLEAPGSGVQCSRLAGQDMQRCAPRSTR